MYNVPKWSDTLYKIKIFKVSDHFGTLWFKGLKRVMYKLRGAFI